MPFIKLRKFLGCGISCIPSTSILKTCGILIRLKSCICSLRINPTLWDHFIDLLNLPNTSLSGPLARKGLQFSLLCTLKIQLLWNQEARRYTMKTVTEIPPCSQHQCFPLRVLGAYLDSTAIPCPLLLWMSLWTGVGENGKTKTNFGFPSHIMTYRGPLSWSSNHDRGFLLEFSLTTLGIQFWVSAYV